MPFKPSNTFVLIMIAIFFGALSGILGFIIVGAGNMKIPFFGTINYANPDLSNRIVIEQPRSVVIEQDTRMLQIENDLLPAVINVYKAKKSTDLMSAAYKDSELLGRGFVLTADGWVVTTAGAVDNLKGSYTAIGYQNKKYSPSGFIADKATGAVFAKMNAANLPVARLGNSSDLHVGQTVVIVSGRDSLTLTQISKIGYSFGDSKDLAQNSDQFKKRIFVSVPVSGSMEGSILVNFKGEVIGIVSGGAIIPIDYFKNIIDNVLAQGKVIRASLGVDYVDLAQVDGLIDYGDKGAFVIYDPLGSSAASGQIKKGDVIKKVNDIELNAYVGLSEAINQFKMNDKVELTVSRGGKDQSVSVTLK